VRLKQRGGPEAGDEGVQAEQQGLTRVTTTTITTTTINRNQQQ
jgi:hypothetical protein